MNLVKLQQCPACGTENDTRLKACSNDCKRGDVCRFYNTSTQNQRGEVHLHEQCRTCDFEWLTPVYNADGVKNAW